VGTSGAIPEPSNFDVTLDRRCTSSWIVTANLGEYADLTTQHFQSTCELNDVGLDSSDARRVTGGDQGDRASTLVHLIHF